MSYSNLLSRRDVLKRGASVAGVAAAPAFLASRAWGAPARLGANEQIGIGIIGPGRQGSGLLQQAAKLGLPTDQPSRLSPSGKEIDKNQNPLGPDLLVTNRIYSLAYSNSGVQYVCPSPVNASGAPCMYSYRSRRLQ